MKLEYVKKDTDSYRTIRQVLSQEFKMSANLILKLKKEKKILLNSEHTYLDKILEVNDNLVVIVDFKEDNNNILPTKMDLAILYEDEYFLVINKPAGIPVHPSMKHFEDSLSNGVKFLFDSQGLYKKIRPVNRLDRNTSGIVIFAKNEYIQDQLVYQMKM